MMAVDEDEYKGFATLFVLVDRLWGRGSLLAELRPRFTTQISWFGTAASRQAACARSASEVEEPRVASSEMNRKPSTNFGNLFQRNEALLVNWAVAAWLASPVRAHWMA